MGHFHLNADHGIVWWSLQGINIQTMFLHHIQLFYPVYHVKLCSQKKKNTRNMEEGSWILHHDNTPAHNALSIKTFLAKHKIPVLEHPPYSPDLDPCDFFIIVYFYYTWSGYKITGLML
jgi:hypothetical protein